MPPFGRLVPESSISEPLSTNTLTILPFSTVISPEEPVKFIESPITFPITITEPLKFRSKRINKLTGCVSLANLPWIVLLG